MDDPAWWQAVPSVKKIDQDGRPLKGMIWGGTDSVAWGNDGEWFTQSFSAYSWTNMAKTSFTDGPLMDIPARGNNAESCADSNRKVRFWEVKAPQGYRRAVGVLKLCLTRRGWIVESQPGTGDIRYDRATNTVIFRNRRIATPAPSGVLGDGGELPSAGQPGAPTGLPATGAATWWHLLAGAASITAGWMLVRLARPRRAHL